MIRRKSVQSVISKLKRKKNLINLKIEDKLINFKFNQCLELMNEKPDLYYLGQFVSLQSFGP